MEVKLIPLVISILLSIQLSFGQKDYKYTDGYTFLSKAEYDKILDSNSENIFSGNYYIADSKKNVSIKKYKNGVKTGEWLTFYSLMDGLKLISVANYNNGVLNGYYFTTDNHTISQEGFYKKGLKDGFWTITEVLGGDTKITKGKYVKGKKCEVWEIINNETSEKETVIFKKGKRNGKYLYVNENNKVKVEGRYLNDKKNGVWITQDSNLGVVSKEVYKNGILIHQ